MLLLGKTKYLERLPEPITLPDFQIEYDDSDKLIEFASSNAMQDIDLDSESLKIERKSVAFFLAVSHNRLRTFADILKTLQKMESEMVRRVEQDPELSNKALVDFHEQMMKRMTMELELFKKAETTDPMGNVVNVFSVKNDNRRIGVNSQALPAGVTRPEFTSNIEGIMDEVENLTPDGRKKIGMLVDSLTSKANQNNG